MPQQLDHRIQCDITILVKEVGFELLEMDVFLALDLDIERAIAALIVARNPINYYYPNFEEYVTQGSNLFKTALKISQRRDFPNFNVDLYGEGLERRYRKVYKLVYKEY